ncbi:MAG: Lipopolysaccharide assembly protein B [Candidatus Ordinivivax streblomastigis]|uniref:Lipopolysaccharide assembly protein B n=1 Tax=Candidatus Ordinivivax streblomastigis TaxID=2540710 RepID=A0A5M8P4W0_9BACT|nr:MAG: Lipopolysaccharide assembly protein B [Candidatus Ordinivivax streblomastigis]
MGWSGTLPAQINTNRVLAIGKNALYFEDYVLSIQYFNQVIKAKPYLAEPYFYRAAAKLSLEDYNGAESDFTLCLERNPFLVQAYQYRGAARQSLGNYDGAIEDYNKGLEFRPEDKQILLNKSIAFLQEKKYDEAAGTLDILLKYQPKYTNAYLARGAVFIEKGDTVEALSNYDKALELDKYYAQAYGQRAMLHFQTGDYPSALKDFDQAIHLETQQAGYHINRGLVRYHLNDLRGAMADYDLVVGMDAQNVIARFNRGLLRSQVGDVYGALEDFDKVIVLEPDNFPAIYNRALLNEEAARYADAVTDLNTILEEYPNFIPAYHFRAELKRKMKDQKGADKDSWLAYDLEQKLQTQKTQGKIVTGKSVYNSEEEAEQAGKTREQSDKDISKFNRLVIYDKEAELQSKYKNEIRGRVQDKQVKVDLEPQFILTYYEAVDAIDRSTFRNDKLVSDYNQQRTLNFQLKIVNHEAPLSDDQAAYHFQSIDRYSLILDRNPSDINAYFARALDFMVLQDLSEAIDDFGRAIALDPGFALAYFNRAAVRYKQMEITDFGDTNSLSLKLESPVKKPVYAALNTYPHKPLTEHAPQEVNETKRNFEFDLIMRDYETAIRLNPDFVYAYFNRANIRCLQKDYRAAIADYNEAVKRHPDFAEAWFNRGLTRLYLGETTRGIEDLSKAGELGIVGAYSIIKKITEN